MKKSTKTILIIGLIVLLLLAGPGILSLVVWLYTGHTIVDSDRAFAGVLTGCLWTLLTIIAVVASEDV